MLAFRLVFRNSNRSVDLGVEIEIKGLIMYQRPQPDFKITIYIGEVQFISNNSGDPSALLSLCGVDLWQEMLVVLIASGIDLTRNNEH